MSLGAILLFVILGIAASLRLGWLGALALDSDQAAQALAAWAFWQPPAAGEFSGTVSPAYFTFTAIFFAFVGDSDAIARLAPSIFGLITVLLPWMWRSRLGTAGALLVSALLAVSPTMNMASTTANGEAMAVAAILFLLIAGMRFQETAQPRWLLGAAVALGFGLTTAPVFYSGLITLAVAWLAQRILSTGDRMDRSGDGRGIPPGYGRLLLATGSVAFIAVATFFLWRLSGLGDAAGLLGAWLGQFDVSAGLPSLALPILALGRYESVVITLGAAAILWASWRGDSVSLFLVYCFAAGLLLIPVQQGAVTNVLVLVLPAYLLLGRWLNHTLQQPAGDVRWALAFTLLVLGVIAYFNGARYLRVSTFAPQQVSFLFLAFVAVASVFVAINFVRSWDRSAAYQGGLTGIVLLFLIFNWGTARWMLAEGGNDPREYWVETGGDDDLRMLASLLEEISWQSTSSAHNLTILSAVDSPALRWYLRSFPNAIFGQTVPPGVTQNAIITNASEEAPSPGEDYLGSDLGLIHVYPDSTAVPLSLTERLRWWLFHEHPAPLSSERIILWTRNDLLQ